MQNRRLVFLVSVEMNSCKREGMVVESSLVLDYVEMGEQSGLPKQTLTAFLGCDGEFVC